MRLGQLSVRDKTAIQNASSQMMDHTLTIDDSASRMVSDIAANARRYKREGKLDLLVIDYLQLIKEDNSRDSREQQVAKIARRLKGLARELEVPVICLSQLNRQTEASGDHRPKLSQLRESGAIEQDADVVMFVHREAYYQTKGEKDAGAEEDVKGKKGKKKEVDEHDAEIIVAKQRNGPTGTVHLHWESKYTQFANRTRRDASVSEYGGDFDGFEGEEAEGAGY